MKMSVYDIEGDLGVFRRTQDEKRALASLDEAVVVLGRARHVHRLQDQLVVSVRVDVRVRHGGRQPRDN